MDEFAEFDTTLGEFEGMMAAGEPARLVATRHRVPRSVSVSAVYSATVHAKVLAVLHESARPVFAGAFGGASSHLSRMSSQWRKHAGLAQ